MCFVGGQDGLVSEMRTRIERKRREEVEKIANQVPPAPNPFAVLSPRLGIQSVSDVRPGERGRKVSVGDIKVGL